MCGIDQNIISSHTFQCCNLNIYINLKQLSAVIVFICYAIYIARRRIYIHSARSTNISIKTPKITLRVNRTEYNIMYVS